eukprot:3047616-Rhodomonas_salina.2
MAISGLPHSPPGQSTTVHSEIKSQKASCQHKLYQARGPLSLISQKTRLRRVGRSLGRLVLKACYGVLPGSESAVQPLLETIKLLLPAVGHLPMTTKNLGEKLMVPRKDYDTETLHSGALQLAPGTQLVVDQTVMEPGQLSETGVRPCCDAALGVMDARGCAELTAAPRSDMVCLLHDACNALPPNAPKTHTLLSPNAAVRNMSALQALTTHQLLPFDFSFYNVEFPMDVGILVASEGKPLIHVDCVVKLLPDAQQASHPPLQQQDPDVLELCQTLVGMAKSMVRAASSASSRVCCCARS